MWCSLEETEPFSIEYQKTHFQSFKVRVDDPDKPIKTPSKPFTIVTKRRPAQKKTPEFQAERNLKCAQLLQNPLREEHIIKTKYSDIPIILVLVLLDTQIQLSNKNKNSILVYSHSFSCMYIHYFLTEANLFLVQFYIQKTELQSCGTAWPMSSNRSVAELATSFKSRRVFSQIAQTASLLQLVQISCNLDGISSLSPRTTEANIAVH